MDYECKKDNSKFCGLCLEKHFNHVDQVKKIEDTKLKETIQNLMFNIEIHKARVDQCFQNLVQAESNQNEMN